MLIGKKLRKYIFMSGVSLDSSDLLLFWSISHLILSGFDPERKAALKDLDETCNCTTYITIEREYVSCTVRSSGMRHCQFFLDCPGYLDFFDEDFFFLLRSFCS